MDKVFRIKHKIKHTLQSRHRRGHGVHSPFFFRLVTEVIENKHKYYAYKELEPFKTKHKHPLTHKRLLLLFRIANSFACNRVLILGNKANSIKPYIEQARKQAKIETIDHPSISSQLKDIDFIVLSEPINEMWVNFILNHANSDTCIVGYGVFHDAAKNKLWKDLSTQWSHSIEFHYAGILFNKKGIPQQTLKY